MSNPKKGRAVAVLKLPRNVPAILAFATSVVKALKKSRFFPNLSPSLAEVSKAIDALRAAHQHARLGTRGAAKVRDEKLATLVALLGLVRAHVQGVADLDPARGRAIVRGAGLDLRKALERSPPSFRAKLGADPGTVVLVAPMADRRASYEWQYKLDGGDTWIPLPSTLQSRTSVSGLRARTVVEFRYRAITRVGEGAWSGAIAIFVPRRCR